MRPRLPIDVRYDPALAALRLAADVARTRLYRRARRWEIDFGCPGVLRRPLFARPVHWHELPPFVRAIAQRRGIDIT